MCCAVREQSDSTFRRFAGDCRAGAAVAFAIMAPVLIGAVGIAVDYALAARLKTQLQSAADAGALAGARELALGPSQAKYVAPVANQVATAHLRQVEGRGSATVSAALTKDQLGVEVNISQMAESFFSKLLAGGPIAISVKSVATTTSKDRKICVLGLDPSASQTISLDSNSVLTASSCGVYSNSESPSGLSSLSNAVLRAQLICSSGGKTGSESNFVPRPITDCPRANDPLATRAAPPVGPCKEVGLVIKEGTHTLSPGTYCDGLTIDSNARVQLSPGIYVIKDGPFVVDSNAQVSGNYVGLFFTGRNAHFRFTSNAVVSLGAPKDGAMAGLLFYEDRANAAGQDFTITSNYTRNLLGTVYLPRGRFLVDANNAVADHSAYTIIVARQIHLRAGPNLVVNANYDSTDVPVPAGLGPVRGKTSLTQ